MFYRWINLWFNIHCVLINFLDFTENEKLYSFPSHWHNTRHIYLFDGKIQANWPCCWQAPANVVQVQPRIYQWAYGHFRLIWREYPIYTQEALSCMWQHNIGIRPAVYEAKHWRIWRRLRFPLAQDHFHIKYMHARKHQLNTHDFFRINFFGM